MSRRKHTENTPVNPLVARLRRKIGEVIVRELIDEKPDFRANVRSVVEDWGFPSACGDPDCARAQACARDFECYVLTHADFGELSPRLQNPPRWTEPPIAAPR